MADRTPLKIADRNVISDGDPFAELTRIMGFDPRQPAKPQAEDPVMGDDFDIDLEKELMGEFGLDADDGLAVAVDTPAPEAEPEHEHAPVSAHELDEAVAASMQDFDLAADEDAPHSAAPEVEFERDFDDALTQSFEVGTRWPEEEAPEAFVQAPESFAQDGVFAQEEPVTEEETAEPVSEAIAPQDFDAHFDNAMADVDMDFDLRAEPADEPEVLQAPEVFADSSAAYDEQPAEEPAVGSAEPFDDAFSLDLHDEPAEAAAIEPAMPVAVDQERSLEDELNALLGNMGARISKPESASATHSWTSSIQASAATSADPFVVAAAGYGAQQPVQSEPEHPDNASEAHPEADLDALLLHELATSGIGYEAPAETAPDAPVEADAHATDLDLDTADFEAFVRDDEAEQAVAAESAAEPQTPPIIARSWNRGLSMAAAQPAPVEPQEFSASTHQPAPEPDHPVYEPEEVAEPVEASHAAAYGEVPDVETVDVPERVVALADDLDLPEVAFDEDRPAPTAFDDLDAEFAGLLSDMNSADAAPVPSRAPSYDDEPYEAGFNYAPAPDRGPDRGDARAYAAQASAAPVAAAAASYDDRYDASGSAGTRPFAPVESFDADNLDYDPELDEAMAVPGLSMTDNASQPRRRGLVVAAVVAGVALVGGIGAFVLSPGGGGSDAPVLVKADEAPIKVKPENPGGTVVPNQDNKVYEAVAKGIQPAAPAQQKLVANTQEPVNVNTAAPQNRVVDLSPDGPAAGSLAAADTAAPDIAAPTAKSEDRIDQSAQQAAAATTNQDVALVTPRKVRTMIVKPDGTLAPREETEPAAPQIAAAEPADPAPQRVVATPTDAGDQTGAVPQAAETVAGEPVAKPAAKANAQSATTPATVAAVPQRPSDQPVDIVGEVKPDEVASISPTAASAGSWSMQIASQPSADSAQSSYKDLARRYASILDGKPVNIVKADIAGKGTFYRVRIPANSRNDAISLCESYKAAGGNCFVSK